MNRYGDVQDSPKKAFLVGHIFESSNYYVAHYVWPYHETVRMSVCLSVCLSVTCHISKTEPDRAIVTMDHYIEVGCN